jgi:two-component system sensor histidine kinase KdpD
VNIIENALKYTPAGTAIEISAEFEPASVTVTIADEGPGIPSGLEERLFDKFYRASPERAQSGVGLGLTICRAIVEAHGGTIRAENRFPHGAAFRFTLPRDEAPPTIEGEEAPQARFA